VVRCASPDTRYAQGRPTTDRGLLSLVGYRSERRAEVFASDSARTTQTTWGECFGPTGLRPLFFQCLGGPAPPRYRQAARRVPLRRPRQRCKRPVGRARLPTGRTLRYF